MKIQAKYFKHNFEARSNNHCYASAVSTTYSDYVFVTLVIQHEKRLRLITFSSVTLRNVPYFSALSHKRYDFRKKFLNMKYLF
jgi:hypothetical protein